MSTRKLHRVNLFAISQKKCSVIFVYSSPASYRACLQINLSVQEDATFNMLSDIAYPGTRISTHCYEISFSIVRTNL